MRPERIPSSLRALERWTLWRYEERDGRKTKVPYRPDGTLAKSNDPATWCSLDDALKALKTGRFAGLGFVLGDGITGIDLDWKEYPGEGVPTEARTIVDRLDSYVEWSPSGKGCHILLHGKLPEGCRNRKQLAPGVELEVYDRGRFFTFTGHRWEGYPDDLQECQTELEALLADLELLVSTALAPAPAPAPHPVALDDKALLEKAFAAKNGADVRRLWEGDTSGYRSQSEADLALAGHLMFWCGNDTARADRLFRQSKLYRPKWDEKHHADGRTYGQATLEKARSSSPYNPQHPHVAGAGPRTPLDERTGGGQVLGEPRYKVEHGQILAAKVEGRGEAQAVTYYPLSNFAAAIRREVVATDGLESEVLFELEGYTATGRALPVAQVRAAEFASMNWVTKHWGSEAVVQPGQGAKDHLRAAIQYLSLGLTTRATVHKHLGWAKVGGHHVYLHAGGGIGPDGAVPGLEVDPGRALSGFILPEPPTGEAEREAILQLWELRHLAPARVTVPLILYSLAAPLGHTPFSLYLSGPTGARKTSLALVLQSLWGGHDAPPTGWEATANALEGSAFTAKDSLLLIDDYAPQNAEGRQKELQAKAARLLRNQGNGVGRLRMRADGSLAPDKPPRGSLLITGEDLPPGHSVRARCLFLELERGDVDLERLSRAQALARDGVYAQALGAWVRYLARALEDHQARLTRRVAELRPRWSAEHGRTTDALARLHATWETYRVYAATVGVELQALEAGVLEALEQVRTAQAQHHKDADPAERFGALLFAALRMGRAHLVPTDWRAGQSVEDYLTHPASWGWQYHEPTSSSDFAAGVWRPQGPAIGWIPSDPETHGIYLDPKAAYAVLARLAGETGEPLPTERTLWKRLGEAGAIRTQADGESVRYQARVRIGGELHRVVHVLGPYIGKTGNTGNNTTNTVQDDTKPVPGFSSVPGSDREQNPDPDTPPVVFPEATGNNPETGNSLNSVQDDKNSPVPGVPGFADRRPLGFAQPPEDEDGEWEVVEL